MKLLYLFCLTLFLSFGIYTLSFSNPETKSLVETKNIEGRFLISPEGFLYSISFQQIEKPNKIIEAIVTAYSPLETDDTPFETAIGLEPIEGKTVANNSLPLGTLIKIPEIFGEQIFIVTDRMNQRMAGNYFDIFYEDQKKALEFGVKKTLVEILD